VFLIANFDRAVSSLPALKGSGFLRETHEEMIAFYKNCLCVGGFRVFMAALPQAFPDQRLRLREQQAAECS
jgi:hypothetical protein